MLVLTLIASRYKPKFIFSKKVANELLHFGKFIFGSSVILFLILNLDKFFIGRMLGAVILGYYALAFNISSLTTEHLSSLINRVLYPAYSKIQTDKDDLKRISLKVIKSLALFSLPFGLALILLSSDAVRIIYGPKWLPMVPSLKVLALCSMFLPIASVTGSVFLACSKPRWNFGLNALIIILMTVTLPFMMTKYGLLGATIAITFSKLVILPIQYKLLSKLINIRLGEIVDSLKPAIISSLIMGVAIYALKNFIAYDVLTIFSLLSLGSIVLVIILLYLTVFYIADKNTLIEIRNLIFSIGE
jgi:O-antigen/teichoic acid export membrane protein